MSNRVGWVAAALLLVAAGYLASGVAVVQPDEVAVVRRLGAVLVEPWEPGLHWGLPWGIDQLDRIKLNQTRTLSVGASSRSRAPCRALPILRSTTS